MKTHTSMDVNYVRTMGQRNIIVRCSACHREEDAEKKHWDAARKWAEERGWEFGLLTLCPLCVLSPYEIGGED